MGISLPYIFERFNIEGMMPTVIGDFLGLTYIWRIVRFFQLVYIVCDEKYKYILVQENFCRNF